MASSKSRKPRRPRRLVVLAFPHVQSLDVTGWSTPELVIVPMANGSNPEAAVGNGYSNRLTWAIGATVNGSEGSWEALVDAKSGELLAFYDQNSYIDQKKVVGGIFPVSNDGLSPGGVPDGIEQPGYPMSRLAEAKTGARSLPGAEAASVSVIA